MDIWTQLDPEFNHFPCTLIQTAPLLDRCEFWGRLLASSRFQVPTFLLALARHAEVSFEPLFLPLYWHSRNLAIR